MLEVWLTPQLRDRGLGEDVWLQHDAAPTHFALTVRDILNEHLTGPLNRPWFTNISHSIILATTHRRNLCGALSMVKWLRTAIAKMTICAGLWHTRSPPLRHKFSGACHTERCDAHPYPPDVQRLSPQVQWTATLQKSDNARNKALHLGQLAKCTMCQRTTEIVGFDKCVIRRNHTQAERSRGNCPKNAILLAELKHCRF
jgi:hypothetical protein